MIINALRGRDISVDSTERVIFRVQGKQYWIDAPATGEAIISGDWTRGLRYYGGRTITAKLWIGKTEHTVLIEYRG